MQAGRLRHRIMIQTPTSGDDPFNTATAAQWNNVATVWSAIDTATEKNVNTTQTGDQSMQVSHVITMRYPGKTFSVNAGDQVLYGTRVFQVLKGMINEEERNIMLQLLAWEINPAQGGGTT